jgi:hypothetical protein
MSRCLYCLGLCAREGSSERVQFVSVVVYWDVSLPISTCSAVKQKAGGENPREHTYSKSHALIDSRCILH